MANDTMTLSIKMDNVEFTKAIDKLKNDLQSVAKTAESMSKEIQKVIASLSDAFEKDGEKTNEAIKKSFSALVADFPNSIGLNFSKLGKKIFETMGDVYTGIRDFPISVLDAFSGMMDGISEALEGSKLQIVNYKKFVDDIFTSLQNSLSAAFVATIDDMILKWERFEDVFKSIGDVIKKAFIKLCADVAAEWVMSHIIMKGITLAWKAIEITAAAAVGAAKAAAASGYALWGAIAIGLAVGAGILAMAGAFAQGGIVGGNSFSGDNMLARVNSGEMILNKQQQANLWNMANGMNSLTVGAAGIEINQNINIANGSDIESITDALRRGTLEALEFANLTVKVGNKQSGLAV